MERVTHPVLFYLLPVDGWWGPWDEGKCSQTCGPGVNTSYRTCNPPKCDGAPCVGNSTKIELCNLKDCPACVFKNKPYNEGDEVEDHPDHGVCKRW